MTREQQSESQHGESLRRDSNGAELVKAMKAANSAKFNTAIWQHGESLRRDSNGAELVKAMKAANSAKFNTAIWQHGESLRRDSNGVKIKAVTAANSAKFSTAKVYGVIGTGQNSMRRKQRGESQSNERGQLGQIQHGESLRCDSSGVKVNQRNRPYSAKFNAAKLSNGRKSKQRQRPVRRNSAWRKSTAR